MGLFSKIMGGSHADKELRDLRARAEAIYKRGEELQSLSDEELAAKTVEFKRQLQDSGPGDPIDHLDSPYRDVVASEAGR